MKTICTIILLSISAVAFSQPEITEANIPLIGDQVTIAICSGTVQPGEAGANQTWDMTWLVEQEEQFFHYMAANEGPHADSFPNANLCSVSWENSYSFYRKTPNSLTAEGYVIPIDPEDTTLMVYDNAEQIIGLPYSMNSSFTDEFEGNSYVPGFGIFPFDGELNFEADGYGTLILPTGTYENVVRYHFYREQTNYLNGVPATTQTKDQWAWVSEDYRFWLLLMEENFDGFTTSSLIWYDKNPYPATTGISDAELTAGTLFPNPLQSGQNLYIRWDQTEVAKIAVYTVNGTMVSVNDFRLEQGTNTFEFPRVAEGMYIIKIITDSQSASGRIMCNN